MALQKSSSKQNARRYAFPAAHRLKRRRLIRPLFDRSRDDVRTQAAGTVRIVFRVATIEEVGTDVPLQIGFSAGRAARSGVQRNRIRRLLREVYRVNQALLTDLFSNRGEVLTLMVLYRGRADGADEAIPRDLPRVMKQMRDRFQRGESSSSRETGA